MNNQVQEIVDTLKSIDTQKIEARAHGWKAENKRFRKAALSAEKALKAARQQSLAIEKE